MPKLGFKQTVDQAEEAAAGQIKRFADDILRASRAARSEPKTQRREREGTLASVATSLNMSFMSSNANLGLSTPTSDYLPPGRAKAGWRPPSLQSTTISISSQSAAPTSLYAVLANYASIIPVQQHSATVLPHESEVLSALLPPFMSVRGEKVVNEQLKALEAFETIMKTWRAASETVTH